jgi:cold shock CspA family protein
MMGYDDLRFFPPLMDHQYETGAIKHLNEKGYGFIARDGGGEVFFHASKCGKLWTRQHCELSQGTKVRFWIGKSIKGTDEARDIQIVSDPMDGDGLPE